MIGFDDLFGRGFSDSGAVPSPALEKGVPLRGRDIDGAFYVRVEDIVALLELNDALPKAAAQLKTRTTR